MLVSVPSRVFAGSGGACEAERALDAGASLAAQLDLFRANVGRRHGCAQLVAAVDGVPEDQRGARPLSLESAANLSGMGT